MQNFYAAISPIYNISDITKSDIYHAVPLDWHIAMTDIRGSTQAIQNGRYRDVNSVAAASITALINQCRHMEIPFVFGGDGATVLIPAEEVEKARETLLATRQMAWDAFNLNLRVGIIPVTDMVNVGYEVRVAKLEVSENFQQAIFTGGGLSHAENLLKHPIYGEKYRLEDTGKFEADFSGFECRWNEIRSKHEETVSLIIQATIKDEERVYQQALTQIATIYGDSKQRHPISIPNLKLRISPGAFKTEAIIRFRDVSFKRLWTMAKNTFKARIAMWFNIQGWGAYKQILVDSTDNEKFDDALRMIISGNSKQREALCVYLETQREAGQLVYGVHTSGHTLMTCIVFDYFGRQVHFVDGSNGGYALAARQLKSQLTVKKSLLLAAYDSTVPDKTG